MRRIEVRRRLLYSLLSLLALAGPAGAAQGAVFSRDWKTPGDGLLTYDDVNQREWLDLTETILRKFPAGPTVQDSYNRVVAQTLPGGMFEGFSVASAADVTALAQSAGIDTTTFSFSRNQAPADALIDLLSPTFIPGPPDRSSGGFLNPYSSTAGVFMFPSLGREPLAGVGFSEQLTFIEGVSSTTGVWLYRPPVPEPSALLLASAFPFALRLFGRRRRLA